MSCAAFTFLSLWVALKNKGSNWVIVGTIVLAICFFLVAAFMAWDGEREVAAQKSGEIENLKRIIANLDQPDLQPKVTGVATAGDKAGNAIVIISVQVTNKGANSSLLSPRAEVHTADGKNLHLTEVVPPMGNIHMHGMNGDPKLTWTLNPESFLPKVLASGPIVRGGNTSGWIIFAADAKRKK